MAHPSAGGAEGCTTSVHEFFDRLIQLVDGLLVAGLHSVGQTVVDVILQDDLCCVVERRAHGCELDEHLQADEVSRALRRCIGEVLDAREAEIIRLRYAIGGGEALTQRETAQRCGISRSYVSRIEKKAIEKLRAALQADGY